MAILETKELKKYYGSNECLTKALDGVSLEVEEGEFVAIVTAHGRYFENRHMDSNIVCTGE